MIQLYWEIGKGIVVRQEKYGWGRNIVEKLADDLRKEFSGQNGFSTQNLWYMRQFFLTYKDNPNLQRFVGELPWGQNLVILAKAKNLSEKEFYLRETIRQGWTRDVLVHQIESHAHRRFQARQHNFEKALPVHLSEQADKAVKDGYSLDFLGSGKAMLERDLEEQLVGHIRDFLVELGLGFCFLGNQFRIVANNKEYFIDLLFFHRHLKCLVALELKIGDFKPEFAGKMNFYLNLLDDHVRLKDENPSIGIVLCKSKDRFEVEYALRGVHKPMGVAQYSLSQKLPKKLVGEFPTPQQLQRGLMDTSK